MEILLGVCLGAGLSAACGFRVFVPLLVVSIAALSGHVTLASPFAWIGSYPALVVFGAATAFEVSAYYVPWLDNLLDAISTPAAVVAGIVLTASFVTGVSPLMRWTLAIIVGGGAAGTVQVATDAVRLASSVSTGGVGNPLVATGEIIGSTVLSLLAVAVPVVAGVVAFLVVFLIITVLFFRRRTPEAT